MADETTTNTGASTTPKAAAPSKVEPDGVDLVVGSNEGQAIRYCNARGIPRAKAVQVDYAVDRIEGTEGLSIAITRDPADRAVDWEDVAEIVRATKAKVVECDVPEAGARPGRGRRARRAAERAQN